MASGAGIQIDSLIVSLGLDPSKFTQGQAAAVAAFKNLQQEATKNAKGFEEQAQRILNFMSKIRAQAIGFAAAAFGAGSISDFVQKVTTSNAALERTSRLLGISARDLESWKIAVELAGGSAEAAENQVMGLYSEFARFGVTGQSAMADVFNALQLRPADSQGKMKGFRQFMAEMTESFAGKTKPEQMHLAQRLGFDPATTLMVSEGGKAFAARMKQADDLNRITDESVRKSRELEQAWRLSAIAAKNLGNEIVTTLSPALIGALDFTGKLVSLIGKMLGGTGENIGKIWERVQNASAGGLGSLRFKQGVGEASPAMMALAMSLQQSVPGLQQFTSFNDAFHRGKGSKHEQGLALDFTLKGGKAAAAAAATAIRNKLAAMGGVDAKVIDEYNFPSKGSSGDHIHVSFRNQASADQFRALGAGNAAAMVGPGAGASSTVTVNTGDISINAPGADSKEIAANIATSLRERIRMQSLTAFAQLGAR